DGWDRHDTAPRSLARRCRISYAALPPVPDSKPRAPWAIGCHASSPRPEMPAPPAWATARASARTPRGSPRLGTSTSSTRRSASRSGHQTERPMAYRRSRNVTRTGDAGTPGLGDGSRVGKDTARIASIGDVDELNSTLGLLLAEEMPAAIRAVLTTAQHDLFDL